MGMMKRLRKMLGTDKKHKAVIGVKGDVGEIKKALKNGERISTADGFIRFGTSKLTSRVSDLRKSGMKINDCWMKTEEGKRYKIYWI